MLFKEVDKIIAVIEFYDNKEGWRAFVEEVLKQDISNFKDLQDRHQFSGQDKQMQWTKMAIGAGWYSRLIKPLPVVFEIIGEIIKEKEGPPHLRLMLAGALAYLVQEKDLIFDNRKGGYGLIDDAIVIYYTYYKYLEDIAIRMPEFRTAMQKYCQELEAVISTGLKVFPASQIDGLKRVLLNIAMGCYYFPEAPEHILEQVLDQVVESPHHYPIGQILARLAYHLNVNFKPYYPGIGQDPILAKIEKIVEKTGSSPGEFTAGEYYYQ